MTGLLDEGAADVVWTAEVEAGPATALEAGVEITEVTWDISKERLGTTMKKTPSALHRARWTSGVLEWTSRCF